MQELIMSRRSELASNVDPIDVGSHDLFTRLVSAGLLEGKAGLTDKELVSHIVPSLQADLSEWIGQIGDVFAFMFAGHGVFCFSIEGS